MTTSHLTHGEYLHLEFALWDTTSIHSFSSMWVAIDALTCMLWIFCTANKLPHIYNLEYTIDALTKDGCIVKTRCMDDNSAFDLTSGFTSSPIRNYHSRHINW